MKSAFEELSRRLRKVNSHFGCEIPPRDVIAWHAYVSAIFTGELLSKTEYDSLISLLPSTESSLISDLMTGGQSWVDFQYKIEHQSKLHDGKIPENVAIALGGYLVAKYEAGFLNREHYVALNKRVPLVENDPVSDLLSGKSEGYDVE